LVRQFLDQKPHKLPDELKKEKKEYLVKLEELNRQVKEQNRRNINFKGTVEHLRNKKKGTFLGIFKC
jgi:hypothetical protein